MPKERFAPDLTPLEKITLTAAMTALSIVLCRFLGYSPANTMFRVELGFLPIALIGLLAGPVYSFVGYGLADLIGSLITTGMNPLILCCKALSGLVLGLFLYRRRPSLPLVLVTLFVLGAGVDVFLMSAVFNLATIKAYFHLPVGIVHTVIFCNLFLLMILSAAKNIV